MEAQVMGRNTANEFLAALQQWASRGRGHLWPHGHEFEWNMLVALNAVGVKGIVCVAHTLHYFVCNAIGLGSHTRLEWDAGIQEIWALMEQCRQLVGHFSHSLKAAHQLCERCRRSWCRRHMFS